MKVWIYDVISINLKPTLGLMAKINSHSIKNFKIKLEKSKKYI